MSVLTPVTCMTSPSLGSTSRQNLSPDPGSSKRHGNKQTCSLRLGQVSYTGHEHNKTLVIMNMTTTIYDDVNQLHDSYYYYYSQLGAFSLRNLVSSHVLFWFVQSILLIYLFLILTRRSFTRYHESSYTVLKVINSNELEPNWRLYRLSVRTACT